MRVFAVLLAVHLLRNTLATPIGRIQPVLQVPLEDLTVVHQHAPRRLHGRFLHITDLHPDPFYKIHSSTKEDHVCHRGSGPAGTYGAETSDCDTPFALVNATFKWIEENVRDKIDFIVWTGDSARHDSDEKIPRSEDQVLGTNKWIAEKFAQVFGNGQNEEDPAKELMIPIISTFGNNDILPHNILLSGPNKWLKTYTDVWRKFIPEEQRHGFERGGWYYVEVIPQKLAVFSLNTLYFFGHNSAVDGCALRSEPGYEHMEWLRIQLQFMRQRGMKAILIGHVPPARTDSKQLWDETCWQKYTLWLQRYRDVVVGGLYGHMNIDHFMLQDTKEIDIVALEGGAAANEFARAMMDEELTSQSANDYLEELRESWSNIPNPATSLKSFDKAEDEESLEAVTKENGKKGRESERDKALKKIGGPWGERFQVTNVGPSVVPNYFPTLRVIEYNITGLDNIVVWANTRATSDVAEQMDWLDEDYKDSTYVWQQRYTPA
jgi:endopolyphosphatase